MSKDVINAGGGPGDQSSSADVGQDVVLDGSVQTPVSPAVGSPVVVTPTFKLIVILVFLLTLLTGAAAVAIALMSDPHNPAHANIEGVMTNAFTACVGAVLGLIGGKAVT